MRIVRWVFWNKLPELMAINEVVKQPLGIYTARTLRWNVFEGPRCVDTRTYNSFFCPFLNAAYGLLRGSGTVFEVNLMRAIEKNDGGAPTIRQVIREIANDKLAHHETRKRLMERNGSLLVGTPARIFDVSDGLNIEEIIHKNVGFALDEIPIQAKYVLVTSALAKLIYIKKFDRKSSKYRHVIILDDLGELSSRGADFSDQEINPSLLEKGSTQYFRENKITVITSTQSFYKLNRAFVENSRAIISFRVGSESRDRIAKVMGLDKHQSVMLTKLGVGQCVVYRNAIFPKAVLVQTPLVKLPEVQVADSVPEAFYTQHDQYYPRSEEEGSIVKETYSDKETTMLSILRENWWCTVTELAEKIAMPLSKASSILNALVERGALHSESFPVGQGSGNIKVFFYTERVTLQFGHQSMKGKGGREHCWWAKRISLYYEIRGFSTEIEKFLQSGQSVDVVATKNGKSTAIELGLSKVKRELENISKLRDFDNIVWTTRSMVTLRNFQKLVNTNLPELFEKVQFVLLSTFYQKRDS